MNATLLLAIATLALVVGPFLEGLARRFPALAALIDGATVGGILVISSFHLMPEAGAHLGWWALLWFTLGLLLPTVAERLMVGTIRSWRVVTAAAVLALFLGHVILESAALVSKAHDERVGLATLLVVVGHRLPVGILLWGHTRRNFGNVGSIVTLVIVGAAAWFVPPMIPVEVEFAGVLSALLAGGLLHLVLQHKPVFERVLSDRAQHAWSAVGLLIAVGLLVPYLAPGAGGGGGAVAHGGHDHAGFDLVGRLLELTYEVSGPLLLGVLGAAAIEAYMPGSVARWMGTGSRLRQALGGVLLGTPMPVCSCGVLPIYRSLIQKGVPATAAMSLLIAAPEIGIDSFLLSWSLLGSSTTLARLGSALVLALVTGWVVGRWATARAVEAPVDATPVDATPADAASCDDHDHGELPGASGSTGWPAFRRGLLETWGHLAPWILVGLFATVMIEPWISTEWSRSLAPWAQVLILSLAGMPTYICATAATPFAAVLLLKGFAPGAVIAFLLTGPATNLTTFGALAKLHSRATALSFVLVALGTTFGLGLIVNALLGPEAIAAGVGAGAEHEHGPVQIAAVACLAALTLWVLFREGPRSFLAQLWPEGSDTREGRAHAH